MLRDETTILDIVRAGQLIQDFIVDATETEFLYDPKTQSSVLYQLLVMGEAVKRLSVDFRNRNPDIPWSLIAGMRDHLIHAYDAVDWNEVWNTATIDVPKLLVQIEHLASGSPTQFPGETHVDDGQQQTSE
jgi:uncharacterized protein with HEPN domain